MPGMKVLRLSTRRMRAMTRLANGFVREQLQTMYALTDVLNGLRGIDDNNEEQW
jgi:hypothetical protein